MKIFILSFNFKSKDLVNGENNKGENFIFNFYGCWVLNPHL